MERPIVHHRRYTLPDGLTLELGRRTLIMGILNVTPDSFSDGGRYDAIDRAVRHAVRMAEEGADIIDIGGESTRPGFDPVPLEEELRRVIPAVRAVREAVRLPISVDTYKAETARQALAAGAHIVNDIWGLQRDPDMVRVVAEHDCPVVIMHNRKEIDYANFIPDVLDDLRAGADRAIAGGVRADRIWLDPGIGFAKDYEHNLELMGRLDELVGLGYPVLLATSRKSFIRRTLDVAADEAEEGTAATVAFGIAQGCQIVRVHDVRRMKRVADMSDAMMRRMRTRGNS